jgi:hypothetical protein
MTASRWLKKFNRHLAPRGERLVRCSATDPRWERLGDYFIENIRTGAVPAAFVTLRQVGTPAILHELDWRRAMRKPERGQSKPTKK